MAGGIRENSGDDLSGKPRDQCHALHRRDAGSADHLHGRRAAGDRGCECRSARLHGQAGGRPEEPLYLTVKDDLSLNLGNDAVAREALAAAIDRQTGGKKDTRIFLRADKAVDYGHFMEIMNLLRDAGYLKIALVGLENAAAASQPAAAGQPVAPAAQGTAP